jgi:hypothetical protein
MNWQRRDPDIRRSRSGKAGRARFFCFADAGAADRLEFAFSIQAVCC